MHDTAKRSAIQGLSQKRSVRAFNTCGKLSRRPKHFPVVDLRDDLPYCATVLHPGHPGHAGLLRREAWLQVFRHVADPPVYAIGARDQQAIHLRCAEPPTANPNKYSDELLDAYLIIEDVDALYAEYAARGVEFTRGVANMPWNAREFIVNDCDGRLLAFGARL
jgi:hypothetical protein